jgi:pimeloyl-ACP methyl ester carboxylesterase
VTQVVEAPDGRRLSVESLGDPDGKPVFMLHGTPGGSHGPVPRGIVLYRLGIRLISYDRPGYPGSTRKKDRTVADAAADVEVIANYFGFDRFSVIGRSGGAPHALACAAILKDRVICAAALGSLAPCDAEGLDWSAGMTDSNVQAFRYVNGDVGALIATLNEQASKARSNSDGLFELLWPELVGHDKEVISDIALRQIIAQVHVEALRETADGWIDDVIALASPWSFELSDITAPVKLWSGSADVFSPPEHTYWLAKRIQKAKYDIELGKAHFGSVEILPSILAWVADHMNAERQARRAAVAVAVEAMLPAAVLAAGH